MSVLLDNDFSVLPTYGNDPRISIVCITHQDVQSRKQPLKTAIQQAATVLGSVNLRGVATNFSSEQIHLLEMVRG